MAGTLTISTLSDGTNSTSSTNCIQGSAKAWVNFNGASPTVRASYNVSSVTRASAGQYTVNFTTAFSDTNYAVVASASPTQSNTYVVIGVYAPSNSSYSNKTTSACAINAYSPAVANYDPYECDIAFFR
jgi:N-methylhydantoinase B/oxoprolinase/acetone carboxylase alpha subunit